MRGRYQPSNKKPPVGRERLYLFIEGPTEESIKQAKMEIKRIVKVASASVGVSGPS